MKQNFDRHFLSGSVSAAIVLGCLSSAHADTRYDSSATLGFAINSITSSNPDNLNDEAGFSVSATFLPSADPDHYYAYTGGDGSFQVSNPVMASALPASKRFTGTFTASGNSPLLGSVDTLHTGQFAFAFSNSGPYRYIISTTLDYALNTTAFGLYASSFVLLDYWNSIDDSAGMDYSGAGTYAGHAADSQATAGAFIWVFTLDPGTSASFTARTAVQSSLISASAVPIPASIWLFASACLGLMNIRKGMAPVDRFRR